MALHGMVCLGCNSIARSGNDDISGDADQISNDNGVSRKEQVFNGTVKAGPE